MMILFITVGMGCLAAFVAFITESTKVGGNTRLYIPAWIMLGISILCVILAYLWQRNENRRNEADKRAREQREIDRETREIEREERDKQRFEEEKKLWTTVQVLIPNEKDKNEQ